MKSLITGKFDTIKWFTTLFAGGTHYKFHLIKQKYHRKPQEEVTTREEKTISMSKNM